MISGYRLPIRGNLPLNLLSAAKQALPCIFRT